MVLDQTSMQGVDAAAVLLTSKAAITIIGSPAAFEVGQAAWIRVIQRRVYNFRNEECLRLKIVTCTLPAL